MSVPLRKEMDERHILGTAIVAVRPSGDLGPVRQMRAICREVQSLDWTMRNTQKVGRVDKLEEVFVALRDYLDLSV